MGNLPACFPGYRSRTRSAAIAALASAILLSSCIGGSAARVPATPDEVVFSESPPWGELWSSLVVAHNGSRMVLDYGRLVNPATGTARTFDMMDPPFIGTFDAAGHLVVAGKQGGIRGWFLVSDSGDLALLPSLPIGAFPVWSYSGKWIAERSRSGRDSTVRIGSAQGGPTRSYRLGGPVKTVAWVPGDSTLLVLLAEAEGMSSLHALDRISGESRLIADGLDAPPSPVNVAVSDDGRFAYVALASPGVPDPRERHVPDADRDLDIYVIDLASGDRQPVVQTPAEELAPAFADGSLYWVSIESRWQVVILPVKGGDAHVVADRVQRPTWRYPDGRALGVTTGPLRLVDWALNMDGGVIELDADERAAGPVVPIITGYHEDFSPVWSPDGRWIAYHSHRSVTPVTAYEGQGNADDIFLRRPEAPTSEEIRLTDFGWEVGMPDWAPDGRRILMDTWNRKQDASGEFASVWIIEIDPETGALVRRTRVPLPPEAKGYPKEEAWSPVRDEIAITLDRRAELWVLAPDGTSARRITADEKQRFAGLDWSADGEEIIYSALAGDHQQLFSIPRSGGNPRQLTHDPGNLFQPRVSPDGRWVAAHRLRTVRQILQRQVAPDTMP